MQALELKIPPVITFLIAAMLIFGASLSHTLQLPFHDFVKILGLALICTGIGVAVLGVITFRRAKTTVNPHTIQNTSCLVTHGIYQFSRNPMYLGMAFVLTGLAFYRDANMILSVSVLLAFVIYMTVFQIAPEERMLRQLFNNEFEEYKQRTRRWL